MIKLGIIGYPLSHSLSPVMHGAALKALSLQGEYRAYETSTDCLAERIDFFKSNNFKGFNVTIPHKIDIVSYLDKIDDFAKYVGAVNTVVIENSSALKGYNTDVYGFTQAIDSELQSRLKNSKAIILGCGGAARAAAVGLFSLGVNELTIAARNIEKSSDLKHKLEENFADKVINVAKLDEDICLENISIVVNTTPVGMQGKFEGQSPVSAKAIETLPDDAIVYDIVYKPRKTSLLKMAEHRNLAIIDGLDMLILQGAKGFELWTGQKPPYEVMKKALLDSFDS